MARRPDPRTRTWLDHLDVEVVQPPDGPDRGTFTAAPVRPVGARVELLRGRYLVDGYLVGTSVTWQTWPSRRG